MFLQVMNNEEKELFLEFIYKVANIDGEYAEEEEEIVNSYKNELGIHVVNDTRDIRELIDYFSTKSVQLKKILYFETVGLINADDRVDPAEAKVLELMKQSFGLDVSVINSIESAAEKLQKVYDEVYSVLFD